VRYCYERSDFYRAQFDHLGLSPEDVRCVADLSKLPFTTKADLAEQGDVLLCVERRRIIDICQTSGTTGAPIMLPQTEQDLQRLAYNEQTCFAAAGLTANDRVIIACAMGRCFMAGLAYFEGLRRIGATAIRIGAGRPEILAEAIRVHKPSAIIGVPSNLLHTGKLLQSLGIEPSQLDVARLIGIGEPVREVDMSLSALGRRLRDLWQTKVLGTYASTEMATSFAECDQGAGGGHVLTDLIVVEIVDEVGNLVSPGQAGEVVATPLQVTGMPLLRLKTGDIATLLPEPCACGRNTPRIGPVLGRKAQMLKVQGTTLYPAAVFATLQEIEEVPNYFLEIFHDYELSDRPRVVVGLEEGATITREQIAARICGRVRVTLEVAIDTPEEVAKRTMVENRRKPVLVFDYRKDKDKGYA
jgi:phenylacetate-CoA ligase